MSPKGKEEGPLSYACLECWDGEKQCSRSGEQLEGPRFGRVRQFSRTEVHSGMVYVQLTC